MNVTTMLIKTNSYQVNQINAFNDNYIWALVSEHKCAIVDPGDAAPVLDFLTKHSLELTDILLTHHHPDHVGGVNTLLEQNPNINVFGPSSERFNAFVNIPCEETSLPLKLNCGIQLHCIELKGHTIDHIGFIDTHNAFVGDTLFSVGCGRLFEGTAAQMHNSLNKLSALSSKTKIYCAHEYTLSNIEFALCVEPNNTALLQYKNKVEQLRQQNKASIPTTIKQELEVNPFLRVHSVEVQKNINHHFELTSENVTNEEYFAYLRQWKDRF